MKNFIIILSVSIIASTVGVILKLKDMKDIGDICLVVAMITFFCSIVILVRKIFAK